jgi:hypothetical protein
MTTTTNNNDDDDDDNNNNNNNNNTSAPTTIVPLSSTNISVSLVRRKLCSDRKVRNNNSWPAVFNK